MSESTQDRFSSYTGWSMAAKDEVTERLVEDLGVINAFSMSTFKSCECPFQLKCGHYRVV